MLSYITGRGADLERICATKPILPPVIVPLVDLDPIEAQTCCQFSHEGPRPLWIILKGSLQNGHLPRSQTYSSQLLLGPADSIAERICGCSLMI